MKKLNKTKIAVLLLLVVSLVAGLVSCGKGDESQASSGELSEAVSEELSSTEASSENASEASTEDPTPGNPENSSENELSVDTDVSEAVSEQSEESKEIEQSKEPEQSAEPERSKEPEQSEESTTSEEPTTSEESSEIVSKDPGGDPTLDIPEEYKDLPFAKAISKLDPEKGIIMEMSIEESMFSVSVFMAIKGNDSYVLMDMFGMCEEVLTLDGVSYQLDKENKKYTVIEGDSSISVDQNYFEGLKHVKTLDKDLGGVKYEVDVFEMTDDISGEKTTIEFYVLNDEIKYLGQDGMAIPITLKNGNVDKYLVLPKDYTEKSTTDALKEIFTVPEEIKNTKTGKFFSALDFEKGFYISTSLIEDGMEVKDEIGVKGEKVYTYTYYKAEEETTAIGLFKEGYWYYFDPSSHTYYKLAESVDSGLYSWDIFTGLSYVKTSTETKDGVEYTVEKFIDDLDSVYNFYFKGDELVGREQYGMWENFSISNKVDNSLFEIPEGYTEVQYDTPIEDM